MLVPGRFSRCSRAARVGEAERVPTRLRIALGGLGLVLAAFGVAIWVLAAQALPEPLGVISSPTGGIRDCGWAPGQPLTCDEEPVLDGGTVALFTVLISVGVAAVIAALLAPRAEIRRQ